MTTHCDFCTRPLESGEGQRIEIRVTAMPARGIGPSLESRLYVRLACNARCATGFAETIDAGVLASRRALEEMTARELAEAREELRRLRPPRSEKTRARARAGGMQ